MTVLRDSPAGAAPARPALSAGHAASLSTTAGITSVITGVVAASFAAQTPPPGLAGTLACATIAVLAAGALGLYAARNAVGAAMDAAGDPGAGVLAARALVRYHLGMAALFAGLALAAVWRLALPHGAAGWLAAAIGAGAAVMALMQAAHWAHERRVRAEAL